MINHATLDEETHIQIVWTQAEAAGYTRAGLLVLALAESKFLLKLKTFCVKAGPYTFKADRCGLAVLILQNAKVAICEMTYDFGSLPLVIIIALLNSVSLLEQFRIEGLTAFSVAIGLGVGQGLISDRLVHILAWVMRPTRSGIPRTAVPGSSTYNSARRRRWARRATRANQRILDSKRLQGCQWHPQWVDLRLKIYPVKQQQSLQARVQLV